MHVTVLAASAIVYFPRELKPVARASIFASLGLSNFYFLRSTDYFLDDPILKPLLHTWSLCVEEQFYLLYPLLIVMLLKHSARRTFAALATVAILSFATNLWLVRSGDINSAFYLLTSRAWELLAGCLLAFRNPLRSANSQVREVCALVGSLAIICPMFAYDETLQFPGAWAIPPVLGAFLFIASNESSLTRPGSVLSRPAPVFIGKLSFSLYLWHWPIICFASLATADRPWLFWICVGTTFPIAWLAWIRVEEPIRRKTFLTSRSSVARFFATSAAFNLAFGTGMLLSNGMQFRMNYLPGWISQAYHRDFSPRMFPTTTTDEFLAGKRLSIGLENSGPPRFLLWGDSHASVMGLAFDRMARERGIPGVAVTEPGLSVVPSDSEIRIKAGAQRRLSHEKLRSVLDRMRTDGVRTLILANRWEKHLDYPGASEDARDLFDEIDRRLPGAEVYVIEQAPPQRYGQHLYQSLLSTAFPGTFPYSPTTSAEFDVQMAPLRKGISMSRHPGLRRVSTADRCFDGEGRSLFREGTEFYYSDSHHLSDLGSRRLIDPLAGELLNRIFPDLSRQVRHDPIESRRVRFDMRNSNPKENVSKRFD